MLYRIYCHFITWICSILTNVFVPSCPMYWWSVSSDSMLSNPTKKKCMASWQEKSLLVCVWSRLSAYPLISFFVSIFPPPMSSTMSVMKLSLYCSSFFMLFHFASFGWLLLWNLTSEKNLPICVVMVMVITVLFKWTSEPVKAFEGKITYIALTS